jgi:AbiU2
MTIPSGVAEVFEELRKEIIWLHARWILYNQLYGKSEKRVDLLNESAGTFFYVVQETFLADVHIALSKLSDPAATGRFDNLSLEQLQIRIDAERVSDLSNKTRPLLAAFRARCAPFRELRNKTLAHYDLDTALQRAIPLPPTSREMVNGALETLRGYMNAIEGHYEDSETAYDYFVMHASDGDSVAHLLKAGLRYDQLCREEVISWDDFRQSDWHDA